MGQATDLTAAFDAALSLVQRSIATGMTTRDGDPARDQLMRLEKELAAERTLSAESGTLDSEWFQSTVRWITDWAPDTEISLIAALGRIARAATRGA